MGEVDADLVRAPRLEAAAHEARLRIAFRHRVMRDRVATRLVRDDGDLLAVVARAGEARFDRPAAGLGSPQTKAR